MDRQLRWSPEAVEAVEDVESIAFYIERDSSYYARAVVSRIVLLAETIPRHPDLGRIVPEIQNPDYRERFIHKYRIAVNVPPNKPMKPPVAFGARSLLARR